MHHVTRALVGLSGFAFVASAALAVPTPIIHEETPPCDPLIIPHQVDELGFAPPFPLDERLEAIATFTEQPACPVMDDPAMPNALVSMTNLTLPPRAFSDVWYVADRETSITNEDGLAGAPGLPLVQAFKIDTVGVNTPLVFESIAADGVWAPGETWVFIIQDYMNTLGLPPFLFDSIGVPSTASPPSSGSIIVIPEPAGLTLLALGACVLRRRR